MRLRSLLLIALLAPVTACVDRPLGIQQSPRVSLVLSAVSFVAGRAVDVRAYYLRGVADVTLLQRRIDVVSGTQSIALVVDITQCLLDSGQNPPRCAVFVDVRLLDEAGVAIDSGTVGPIDTERGGTIESQVTLRQVSSITVQLPTVLDVGASVQAGAALRDGTGNILTGRQVTWSTSNAAVATVNANGVVTGVSPGTAVISASSEGVSGEATVTVRVPPVATVSVQMAGSIQAGTSTPATAVLRDANGGVLTGRQVTWSSSNQSIATVSTSGVVTGVSVGQASITATSEGVSGAAVVTVTPPAVAVVTVQLSPSVEVGLSTQASAELRDATGSVLVGRAITWSSSNSLVASVSASGVVTGVSIGSANIIATSEGVTGQAPISVTVPAVASVVVSALPPLNVGESAAAVAQVRDQAGNLLPGRAVTWNSNNPAIASVSASGLVTGLSHGTATIMATSSGVSGQNTVSVTQPVAAAPIDRTFDALQPSDSSTPPDLASASITTSHGDMTLRVRFNQGAFNPARTNAQFLLDTDRSAATGHPGIDGGGVTDAGLLGSEYLVLLGSLQAGMATVVRYTGPPINTFALVGSWPATILSNGIDATIPLSAIGGGDGLLNFKVISFVQLNSGFSSPVLDVLPDIGLLPAMTSVVLPAMAGGGWVSGVSAAAPVRAPAGPGNRRTSAATGCSSAVCRSAAIVTPDCGLPSSAAGRAAGSAFTLREPSCRFGAPPGLQVRPPGR